MAELKPNGKSLIPPTALLRYLSLGDLQAELRTHNKDFDPTSSRQELEDMLRELYHSLEDSKEVKRGNRHPQENDVMGRSNQYNMSGHRNFVGQMPVPGGGILRRSQVQFPDQWGATSQYNGTRKPTLAEKQGFASLGSLHDSVKHANPKGVDDSGFSGFATSMLAAQFEAKDGEALLKSMGLPTDLRKNFNME